MITKIKQNNIKKTFNHFKTILKNPIKKSMIMSKKSLNKMKK